MLERDKEICANLVSQQNRLDNFNIVLEQELRALFAKLKSDDCWIDMYTLVRDATLSFTDSQFLKDKPSFLFTLLKQYPNLMTTYMKSDELTLDPDGETSPYDCLCDSFLDLKVTEAIDIGVDYGVFSKENGTINLTPNYISSNEQSEGQSK